MDKKEKLIEMIEIVRSVDIDSKYKSQLIKYMIDELADQHDFQVNRDLSNDIILNYSFLEAQLQDMNRELKNSYKMLHDEQEKVLELERQNSVYAMVVTANHELNQPLFVIKSQLDLLCKKLDRGGDVAPYRSNLEKIANSQQKMEDILKQYQNIKSVKLDSYSGGYTMIDSSSEEKCRE